MTSSQQLDDAVALLAAGGVAAVATDTVFGLVCDPCNADAVEQVYALKNRPEGLELTLLLARATDATDLVSWTPEANRLAEHLWPGPLSVVLPVGTRRLVIPRRGETLSLRVPDHPTLRRLLRETGPLASTSANRHGTAPATSADSVREQFGDEVPVVLDGGHASGVASTIIDCSVTPPRVLREGPIPSHTLAAVIRG